MRSITLATNDTISTGVKTRVANLIINHYSNFPEQQLPYLTKSAKLLKNMEDADFIQSIQAYLQTNRFTLQELKVLQKVLARANIEIDIGKEQQYTAFLTNVPTVEIAE